MARSMAMRSKMRYGMTGNTAVRAKKEPVKKTKKSMGAMLSCK